MQVKVYFNLHSGLWSIKCAESGLVLGHAKAIEIAHPVFQVSEAGRQRVLREQRKNVHAYVCGVLYAAEGLEPYKGRSLDSGSSYCARFYYHDSAGNAYDRPRRVYRVSYNPYCAATFVDKDNGAPFMWADFALLDADRSVRAVLLGEPARQSCAI